MLTECNQESFPFHPLNQRRVVGRFDGGAITSEAGGLFSRPSRPGAQRALGGGTGGAAGLGAGAGLRRPERARRLTPPSPAGGAGREGGPEGRGSAARARPGPSLGGPEHAEALGAHRAGSPRRRTLQEDRAGGGGGGSDAGRGVSPRPPGSPARDPAGPGLDRRPPARRAGRAVLPRLLRA